MRPSVKYPLLTLLWAAVAAYVVWATGATQANRTVRKVDELRIDIVDSTSQGHLVTSAEIRKWLAAERIELLGQTADSVDLTAVEQLIARNGFVEKSRPTSPATACCTSTSANANRCCAY